jgi:hypothetical protein
MSGLSGEADCDTDCYLVVAEVRERLAVSKQTMQKFNMKRLNLDKLDEVEGKELPGNLMLSLFFCIPLCKMELRYSGGCRHN